MDAIRSIYALLSWNHGNGVLFRGRLGFIGRLILIVLLLLLALLALNIGVRYAAEESERQAQAPAVRFPLSKQTAAIVELLDAAPDNLRSDILAAVATPDFSVTIADEPPEPSSNSRLMPVLEWLVAQFLETGRDRTIVAFQTPHGEFGPIARLFELASPSSTASVTIAAALSDGKYAVVLLNRASQERVFGIPAGFLIGVLGSLFAAIALWAIAREAKPLKQLAASVVAFGGDGLPRKVNAAGAPEIRALSEAVNEMQDRISALLTARTVLLGAVSHDLKTLITRLRLRVECIDNDDQRQRATADLDAMTELVDDALAVARGASDTRNHEPRDLSPLLQNEISGFASPAVRLTIDDGPHTLRCDALGIARVISNLVENALQFGTRAEVSLRREDDLMFIVVDDDGPGVPEQERAAIFEPFVRLETSRSRETGGSGLGLAIVRQIVCAHDGSVTVDESPLGGARFTVALPALPSDAKPSSGSARLGEAA